jgi:predicted N-formylglutamate amidohydrolase
VLIELRNDLIANESGQAHWAGVLAPILRDALRAAETVAP